MRKHTVSLAAGFLLLFSANAWANACDDQLAAMPLSRQQVDSNDFLLTDVAVHTASMTAADARQYFQGPMSLPIAGLPLQPNFTDGDFSAFHDWVAAKIDLPYAAQHRAAIRLSSRDPAMVDALMHCLNRVGGLSVMLTPVNSSNATLTIQWWPTAEFGLRSAHVKDVTIEGGYIAAGAVWKLKRDVDLGLAAARTMVIRHRPEQAVRVKLETDLGDSEAYLIPALTR